jgi:hypothetical protein
MWYNSILLLLWHFLLNCLLVIIPYSRYFLRLVVDVFMLT